MPDYGSGIIVVIPLWAVLTAIALIVVGIAWRRRLLPKGWTAVSANVDFAGLGSLTIQPNYADVQIAHRAWIELATRKAGLPFDPDHDLIIDIYKSWYELFGRLRDLAKECPAAKLRTDKDTRILIWSMTQVLNHGLRPHLTKWQARFRRWYAAELDQAEAIVHPQDVQRRFPQYEELVADLVEVQRGLQRYMQLLKRLANGE